ncbi:chemotaxis protein CheW [Hathewaya massiliensis]|uniref:chemotaxis protein CheW n=1 Tax=Hathewaya massiliensis TaxID=1964382 RepID=UPI001157F6FA|nr:chemotaxis protein CheW [Hathewaya massiliensis]
MGIKEIKVLIFKIDEEYYATDIMEVERILGYEETTKIPEAPNFIDGVRNYEGNILPVVNLCYKFNIPFTGIKNDSKVIVAKTGENKIGMLVDLVLEVRDVNIDHIENPPEIVAGISKRYVKGLIKLEDKIIIFLNLASILTDKEKELLES